MSIELLDNNQMD